MRVDFSELQSEIADALTVELNSDESFSRDKLLAKVNGAIREVMTRRNYSASSYSDEQISEDLWNYYSVILNIARYDYNQIGAEGESVHSENSTSRTWVNRNSLFNGVCPFIKVL